VRPVAVVAEPRGDQKKCADRSFQQAGPQTYRHEAPSPSLEVPPADFFLDKLGESCVIATNDCLGYPDQPFGGD
jgi:hypothetical protein